MQFHSFWKSINSQMTRKKIWKFEPHGVNKDQSWEGGLWVYLLEFLTKIQLGLIKLKRSLLKYVGESQTSAECLYFQEQDLCLSGSLPRACVYKELDSPTTMIPKYN